MISLNEFIRSERDSMKFFIDTLSNNWTTAKERVSETEAQIETEMKLIEELENSHRIYLVIYLLFI